MRCWLASGFYPVVAAGAGADHLAVIHANGRPSGGDVTEIALRCGIDMCRRLAASLGAVVA
jgi:hypothetical protein